MHLLLVAFVLLIVVSLGLVAINKVREAANKANCVNNLRQIGLAFENYHATYKRFPPATRANADFSVDHQLSWTYLIVPFLEAGPKLGDAETGWDSEDNRIIPLTMAFRTFQCPSYPDHLPDSKFIPTHYLGISGLGPNAAALPLDDPYAGFFGYERKIKKEDITRGISSTMAVMETAWATGAWTAAPDSVRGLDPEKPPYLGVPWQFGGNHAGGANVLFADGSVRFLEIPFDPKLLEAMVKIAGEHPAD
jgi:prepilin-type processing-associated H-X9-DG protein